MGEKLLQLNDKLTKVYSDTKLRKSPGSWEKALKDAVKEDIYGANIITIEFLQTHKYLPMKVWRTLGSIFNWENNRNALSELFTKTTIDTLCSNMTKELPVRIEYIPESLGSRTDKYITYLLLARNFIMDNQLVQAGIILKTAKAMYARHPDLALLEGEYALKKYDYVRAERILERLSSDDEENGNVLLPLAIVYRDQGEMNKAGRYFRRAFLYNCDERRLAVESGEYFRRIGKKNGALSGYVQYLRKEPYDMEIQQMLNDLCLEIIRELGGRRDIDADEKKMLAAAFLCTGEYKKTLETALPIDKSYLRTVETCLLAGHILWLSGDTEAAERAYHRCASLSKRETKGLFYLGELKASKGHMHDAVACFEKALSVNVKSYPAYLALAKRYLKNDDYQNVDLMASILIRAHADLANAYVLKGIVLENKDEPEEAIRYYNLAIETDKHLEIAHIKKYELLKSLGRSDAEDVLLYMKECDVIKDTLFPRITKSPFGRKRAQDTPESVRELVKSADTLLNKGKVVEAYYNFSKAYESAPDDSYVSFRMGIVLYIMERFVEAKPILEGLKDDAEYSGIIEKLLEDITTALGTMTSSDVEDSAALAQYYYDAGKRKACIRILDEIEGEGVMTAECDVLAGKCSIAFNKVQQADRYFESALTKSPGMVEVIFFRAMTLQALGRTDEAIELYDSAISLSGIDTAEDIYTGKLSLLYGIGRFEDVVSEWKNIAHLFSKASDINGYVGLAYYELGNYNEAERQLGYAIENGSDYPEFFKILSQLLNSRGRYYEAIDCCDRGFDFHPDMAGLYYQKAAALHGLGKSRQAERMNKKALEADPDSDESYYLMGKMFADRNMYREAVESYSKAMEKSENKEKYCVFIADSLKNIGKHKEAAEYYSEAIALNPDNKEARLQRAVLYNIADRDEDALKDLKAVMDKDPDDPDCLLALADILSQYEYVEKDDNIRKNQEDIISASPTVQTVHNDAADEHNEVGTTEEADKAELDADNSSLAEVTGTAAALSNDIEPEIEEKTLELTEITDLIDPDGSVKTDDIDVFAEFPEDAEYYYTRAIEAREGFIKAYINRGKYYIQNGRFDLAMSDFTAVTELDRESTDGYMQKGITELYMGEYKDAIDDFDRVISINETFVSAYNYMVRCYNALYSYETAIRVADAGLGVNSDFLYLNANRAVAYYHTQKYQNALKDLNTVLEQQNRVNTDTVENSYKYRGMCFEALNNPQMALPDYLEAEKYDPDSVEIREAINRLSKGKAKTHKFFGKKEKRS